MTGLNETLFCKIEGGGISVIDIKLKVTSWVKIIGNMLDK